MKGQVGAQLHVHDELAYGGGACPRSAQRVGELREACVALEELLVAQLNACVPIGGYREDAGLEEVSAEVLEQGRVAATADDAVVDLAGLLLLQYLSLEALAVDVHGEVIDGRRLGEREEEGALDLASVLVVESDVGVDRGDLLGDLDIELE